GPFQGTLAKFIARRRTPSIKEQYAQIGGGSPIRMWSDLQGEQLCKLLDETSPDTAPHKHYLGFRYANPLTEDTLDQMAKDGVKRVVAFSQYPQYSCSTTGSSLNDIRLLLEKKGMTDTFDWSVIDRWSTHPGLIDAFAASIQEKLESAYTKEERDDVVLLFTAHSLPLDVVNRGDPYPTEVAASVDRVMEKLGHRNPYRLVWQSKVGPKAWLRPQTSEALEGYAKQGKTKMMMIPIAFTSDHIETLFELDIEYGEEAKELGVSKLSRCDSMNDRPDFVNALATLVKDHLHSGEKSKKQLSLRCPACVNDKCGPTKEFFA
ncbi:ferrochelatase, mitochondrial, partial [Sphaeroforma arctica JP610]